jgi:hypothetical protein
MFHDDVNFGHRFTSARKRQATTSTRDTVRYFLHGS